jgi:glucokinase
MGLTIGLDVGGTKVAAGVVDDHGKILEKLKRPTPKDPDAILRVIADVVAELSRRHDVRAVGLGVAGWLDETCTVLRFSPHLPWSDEPNLIPRLEELTGLPVTMDNDANASAWGEVRFGAAQGERHVMMVAVGTGIGGALVLDGQLYRGRWGMAGEPGHYRVVPDGRPCACGNRGCLEQYASGNALVAEARELATRAPSYAGRLLELGGGEPAGIGGPQVTQAAQEGDAAALDCFASVGGWLGQGLADLAAVLDPGCFVIGGGVSDAGELLAGPAREAFHHALSGRGHREFADVRTAEFGADAGLVGAADLARIAGSDDGAVVGV